MGDIVVKADGICGGYGKKIVLENVSFTLEAGEIVAFLGRNGSGKSTLLQIVAGAKKAKKGDIWLFNQKISGNKKSLSRLIGYVPQDNPLMEELSVFDNLKLYSVVKKESPDEVIEYFSLQSMLKSKVEKLSGGMKRRVAIACAMIGRPPVLILDEPTTALDFYYKDSILRLMEDHCKNGGVALISSHDINEISRCNRMFFIENKNLREIDEEERLKIWKP